MHRLTALTPDCLFKYSRPGTSRHFYGSEPPGVTRLNWSPGPMLAQAHWDPGKFLNERPALMARDTLLQDGVMLIGHPVLLAGVGPIRRTTILRAGITLELSDSF